ncbi:AAA family ATPase [Vibrio comitans]|uniref:Chromosome partitioning ATPase n=1 Tax=Vibrio comitans NBRC 102076 TaxID=1219078 RepID=A0A4Y3IPK3_9VIBR|nr:hypothetical protein [Vibrio comitans]GEA60670.1 chromosome partitioning ATPase [Vibrio comitans NBRC 102076]
MFDLSEELSLDIDKKKKSTSKSPELGESGGVTVFYQEYECKEAILEAYRFEGLEEPKCIKGSPITYKGTELGKVIIAELTASEDILRDAEQLNNRLPNDKAVVIIGKTDSIHTLRYLEKLGFYYIPWPTEKLELISNLKLASENDGKRFKNGLFRKAKRVAVIGSRGGLGTSVITAEICSLLAKKGSRTVLVDHQYISSVIDIIVSKKDLEQVDINSITVELAKLDEESAGNYLYEVSQNFLYLGLKGDANLELLENYTHTLSEKLARQANFIVNDYSASVDFQLDVEHIVTQTEITILVIEPSVSSVRSAQRLLDKINEVAIPQAARPRILIVLNFHRPEGSFNLTKEEVEKFVKHKIDVSIPFYKYAAKQLIDGNRIYDLEKGSNSGIADLTMLINGQSKSKNSFFSKFIPKGRKAK